MATIHAHFVHGSSGDRIPPTGRQHQPFWGNEHAPHAPPPAHFGAGASPEHNLRKSTHGLGRRDRAGCRPRAHLGESIQHIVVAPQGRLIEPPDGWLDGPLDGHSGSPAVVVSKGADHLWWTKHRHVRPTCDPAWRCES